MVYSTSLKLTKQRFLFKKKDGKSMLSETSFCPSVSAVAIGANVIQSHFFLCTSRLRLEEDCLSVIALWAWMVFCSWQSWVWDNISHNLSEFTLDWKKKMLLNLNQERFYFDFVTYSISCMILFTYTQWLSATCL